MAKQSGPVAKGSSERFMGDSAQSQKLGPGGSRPSRGCPRRNSRASTRPRWGPGGRQGDRQLHRTGTNTRLGSTNPAGVNISAGWGGVQGMQGQAGNGNGNGNGGSIGKYPRRTGG